MLKCRGFTKVLSAACAPVGLTWKKLCGLFASHLNTDT